MVPLLNGVDASARLVEHGVPGQQLVDGIAYMTAFFIVYLFTSIIHHLKRKEKSNPPDLILLDLCVHRRQLLAPIEPERSLARGPARQRSRPRRTNFWPVWHTALRSDGP